MGFRSFSVRAWLQGCGSVITALLLAAMLLVSATASAQSPATLGFVAPPDRITLGESVIFTLRLTDNVGNGIAGETISWSGSGMGSITPFSGTTEPTNANGLATFTTTATGTGDIAFSAFQVSNSSVTTFHNLFAVSYHWNFASTPLPGPYRTDDFAPPVDVHLTIDSGNGPEDDPNVPVTFTISSGNAIFVDNGSTTITRFSSPTGALASSGSLRIGRTDQDVVIDISAANRTPMQAVYNVVWSTYTLTRTTPDPIEIDDTATATLEVMVEHGDGITTPMTLPGAEVVWSVSTTDGSVNPPSQTSNVNGLASTTFTPVANQSGSYIVTARFDPGPGATPAIESFTVNVIAPVRTLEKSSPLDPVALMSGDSLSLFVQAKDDGLTTPSGPDISWSIEPASSDATIPPVSTAGTDGMADATLVAGSQTGNLQVRAARADNPAAEVVFDVEVFAYQLSHPSPADATPGGVIGTAIPLKALLQRVGASSTPMGGENVHFVITSGPTGASFVEGDTRPTEADGIARVGLLATQAGDFMVRAEYPIGAPTTSTTFDIRVDAADYQLALVEPADGSRQEVGVVAPVTVRLTQSGNPLTGETIHWSTTLGTLDQPSIQTVADGLSTNQFRPDVRGSATLTARYDSPGGPVTRDFTIVAFENQLIAQSQPPAPLYTEELVAGVVARAVADDGTSATGEVGLAVSFEIIGGDATFAGGGTTEPSTTQSGGFAPSPAIALGRSLADVVIRARVVGRTQEAMFTLPVTASDYSIRLADGSATPLAGRPNATVPLAVVVERTGSGAAQPLGNVGVSWTASGGNLSANTITLGNGQADNGFIAGTPGSYTVGATFDPQLTGVAAATLTIPVEISEIIRSLSRQSGNAQAARPGQPLPLPLVVEAADDGAAPAPPIAITWSAVPADAVIFSEPSTLTDASTGRASVEVTIASTAAPGSVIISAKRSDSPAKVDFTATVQQPALVRSLTKPVEDSGDGQSGPLGAVLPLPLRALALDSGAPASGIPINWTVSGDATLSDGQTFTDSAGLTGVTLTLGNTAQSITVTASRQDAPAATTSFVVTAVAPSGPQLRLLSGDGQRGVAGSVGELPLVVELRDGAGAVLVGSTIDWRTLGGPVSPDAASSPTDADGRASMTFRFGDTPGTAVIRASHGDAQVDFQLESLQAQISATRGDGQSGPPSRDLAEDFVVVVAPTGTKAGGGVTVFWEVTRGGGSLRDGGTTRTGPNGEASNRLRLGPDLGLNEVTATLAGGARVVFQAQAVAIAGQLRIIGGDNQTVPTNDPSAPLVVELRDAAGSPLSGVEVQWTPEAPASGPLDRARISVEHETTFTDEQGRTSNRARVLLPGPARVRAETGSAVASEAVEFRINGGIANIPGLSDEQRRTSQAIDKACPALAAIANRSAEQEDLFQRCLELSDAAGDNPDEVRHALDQIPARLGESMVNAGFGTLRTQFGNHSTRFEVLRKNRAGQNQFDVALWTPTGTLPLSFLPSALGQADDGNGGEVDAGFSRWGFFATGTIGRGKSRGDDLGDPGFEFDTRGLTAGVDYRFSDSLVAGLSGGYARHDNRLRGGFGELDTRGWTVSGYATWFNERDWYVDGVLSYGVNDYRMVRGLAYGIAALDGGRTEVDQIARADTDGSLLGGALSFGRDFRKGPWSLSSYLRGSYSRVELDGYQERMIAGLPGAGLALRFDSRTLESLTSAVGAKATYVISRDWGVLMPHLQLEWEHEFRDDPAELVARFVHDPTGTPMQRPGGREIDSDFFNLGVGVSALFPGGRAVYVYYEQLLGSSRLDQGTLSVGGRFEF
jgi:outer membrane autotransporter protein